MLRALNVHARRLIGPAGQSGAPDAVPSHPDVRPGRGIALDRILLVLVAGGWSIAVAWLTSGLGGPGTQRAVADVGETALDLLAVVIILRAALHLDVRRCRLGWAVLALAMLVYAMGDGAFAWLDLSGGTTSPSLADLAYVSYYPIVVVALFMFQRASSARRDTLRLTIDSMIVVIGGGLVVLE